MLHPFFRRSNVTRGYANEACYRRVVWVVVARDCGIKRTKRRSRR